MKNNKTTMTKEHFIRHRKMYQKQLSTMVFHIACLHYQQDMSVEKIARKFMVSKRRIEEILKTHL